MAQKMKRLFKKTKVSKVCPCKATDHRHAGAKSACLVALWLWIAPVLEEVLLEGVHQDLHSAEIFAGAAANTNGVQSTGFKAEAYDTAYSQKQDILTKSGLRAAVKLALRVKPGGSVWAAPKCSSWVFMSSSQSKRTRSNPGGDRTKAFVREGNELCKRAVAVLLVAASFGCYVYLEQPMSSVLCIAEPMKSFIAEIVKFKVATSLGAFGANTRKPIRIWSNDEQLSRLKRVCRERKEALTYVCERGYTHRKKQNLEESQAYPAEFGQEYGKMVAANYSSQLLKSVFSGVF